LIKENITKQKELLRFIAQNSTQSLLYEAIHDIRQRRSERDYIPIFHPYWPTIKVTDAPESSTVRKRRERKNIHMVVTPLSHRGGVRPSSSQTIQTTTQPDFIDLVTPSPPPPARPLPSPMPPHMRNERCHICGEIGHFSSYCQLFTCDLPVMSARYPPQDIILLNAPIDSANHPHCQVITNEKRISTTMMDILTLTYKKQSVRKK
jgi:hypothetical protein